MRRTYKQGEVYWVELPISKRTHVQGGARPCVVISDNDETSGVITVCPLSTKLDDIKTHVYVIVRKPGQVLCEQITTVDVKNLGNYVGCCSEEEVESIKETLKKYLSL